ncbi:MAG: excisionase family DNA-binding protein [Alphaproteobacteria bacterium]|nr:excisionase family DNA-binding protein [Alphaproteobacteria bacterium]
MTVISVPASPARHFTVQSLAKYWGVSTSHIYNLIHSGSIRYMRIGKAIRIPTDFIKEYEEAACLTTIFTAYGNTITDTGTSFGVTVPQMRTSTTEEQSAYQRGQRIARQQNNSALNSSQD